MADGVQPELSENDELRVAGGTSHLAMRLGNVSYKLLVWPHGRRRLLVPDEFRRRLA